MSVINQMLKDLESRRQSGEGGNNVLDGIAWHGGHQKNRRAPLLATIVIALAVVVGWLVYERINNQQIAAAPKMSAVTSPVTAVQPPVMEAGPEPVAVAAEERPEPQQQIVAEPVQATESAPAASNAAPVTSAVLPVPAISAVSPEVVTANGRSSEVIVHGSGFTKPLSVKLSWANGAASKQLGTYQVRVKNTEQLSLLFNPGTRDDNWTVQVSNANAESSAAYPFRVASATGASEKVGSSEPAATPEAGRESAVVKKLLAQNPADRAAGVYRKASAQLSRGELKEGEAGLRRALELKTDLHAARELLAGLLLRQKRVVEAAQVLDEGLALSPAYTAFIVLRARIYTEQADLPKAISLLESQQPAFENAGDYYALLAALYQRNGRHDAAAELYTRMLQRSPGQAVWHMGLGISLEALGNKAGARESYQRALQGGLSGDDVRNFVKARLRLLQ